MVSATGTLWVAFVFLAYSRTTWASPGDNLDEFDDCLFQCQQISCYHNPYQIMQEQYREALQRRNYQFKKYELEWKFDSELSFVLRGLLWDCRSNCDYQCQRIITRERKHNGEKIYQFHGKWPFLRVFGIQEIFSACFSLANFVAHYIGYRKVNEQMRTNPHEKSILNPMLRNIKFVSLVTMCAWISSMIFHIRDFDLTEKLDYYFAGLTVLSGFYAIGHRYMKLYLSSRMIYAWLWKALCFGWYSAHIYRLVTDWSYTYNMRANITIGILQNILWGLTCYSLYTNFFQRENGEVNAVYLAHLNYIQPKRIILRSFFAKSVKLYSLYPLLLCGIVILGMLLEIFDFPPIIFDLVDAHSLWHLVTVFPAFLGWYDWMLWDVNENVWNELNSISSKKDQ